MQNQNSLDGICAALAYAMGIDAPKYAAKPNSVLTEFVDKAFDGKKADKLIMYNPDAVAQWIYEKYPWFLNDAKQFVDVEIPLCCVMPSVTPVCFGTMYTGAQPEVHGIQGYKKPVITIDTLFDALIRAGKKIAIITYGSCSISRIFLERDIDYYHNEEGDVNWVNAVAAEVILADKHDVVIIYDGEYDTIMHKFGPESKEALSELKANAKGYAIICNLVERNYKGKNTLVGFAMDHGCHEIDGGCGSHGLDMDEDLNIVHFYKAFR